MGGVRLGEVDTLKGREGAASLARRRKREGRSERKGTEV